MVRKVAAAAGRVSVQSTVVGRICNRESAYNVEKVRVRIARFWTPSWQALDARTAEGGEAHFVVLPGLYRRCQRLLDPFTHINQRPAFGPHTP